MSRNGVNKYIREIKKILPLCYKNRKQILTDIENDIDESIKIKKICTYEELVHEFGEPKNIINEFIAETVNAIELKRLRKNYVTLSVIATMVCVMAFSAFFTKYYEKNVVYKLCDEEMIQKDEDNPNENNENFTFVIYRKNGDSMYEVGRK